MPRMEKVDTTHIRIERDTNTRLEALAREVTDPITGKKGKESARDVINRLLMRYEVEELGKEYCEPEALTLDDIRKVVREEIEARLTQLPPDTTPKRASTPKTVTRNLPDGNNPVTDELICTKEAVFLWLGHEIPTDGNEYDKFAKRVRTFVKKQGLEKKAQIGRDVYYPRESIIQFIKDNPLTPSPEREQEDTVTPEEQIPSQEVDLEQIPSADLELQQDTPSPVESGPEQVTLTRLEDL